jgi:hypothetical protein
MSTNPLFTDVYLDRLKQTAERYITSSVNILFKRTPLQITAGVNEYQLPENVSSIVGITYKGNIVLPHSLFTARDRNLFSVINKNTTGTPIYYFTNEGNYNTIRFWPTPSENLNADPSTMGIETGIANQCIVSYYYVADDINTLPEYLRRRVTKYYVMYLAYRKEGKSQHFVASEYFKSKFDWSLTELTTFVLKASGAKIMQMGEFMPANVKKRFNLPSGKFGEEVY